MTIQNRGLAPAVLVALASCAALACPAAENGQSSSPADLAITGATLIEGTGAPPRPETTILVRDGRISAVMSDSEADVPDAATVIDAAGKYVIPGLADMHVHFGRGGGLPNDPQSVERALRQYLYYGVTTVLNLGAYYGHTDQILKLRRRRAEGEILAPNIYATGGLLTVPGAHPIDDWPIPDGVDRSTYDWSRRGVWVVRTPAEVRDVVARMAAAGMDGIKVIIASDSLVLPYPEGPRMPLEMVQAAVEEGREHGLPVFAHAERLHALEVAVEAGVHAVVHLVHCCPPYGEPRPLYGPDPELLAAMRERNIYYVPTLSTRIQGDTWGDPSEYLTDPFLRSGVEGRLIDTLLADPLPPVSDVDWAYRRSVLRTLKAAHDAGVELVGGSDPPNPYIFHGYNMHHELELMVEAGLTPLEALVIATRRPAEMLGEEDVFGTLEPGKRADLLILADDPLEDIRNTRTLEVVVLGGEVIDRSSLLPDEYTSALARSTVLAIRDVTVVDVTDGSVRPNRTVLVEGNRTVAVGPMAELDVPADAEIVEAAGGYLIPGLWDMHVHLFNNSSRAGTNNKDVYFPLLIANGVTGVRDMWTDPDDLKTVRRWRDEMETGELLGPRIVAGSSIVDGVPTRSPNMLGVSTPEEAREAVRRLEEAGAGFIKVYWNLSPEAYDAIADEAMARGIPFAGHVPHSVSAAHASDAGQASIEHLTGLIDRQEICSSNELETRAPDEWTTALIKEVWRTDYEATCRALFNRFARNGTWNTPTLTIHRMLTFGGEASVTEDVRLRYVPSVTVQGWLRSSPRQHDLDPAVRNALFRWPLKFVGAMHEAGVPLLAGSDVGNPFIYPGFSLHDELELFVDAGLTPIEALQTATLNPARFLGRTDELGAVEEGKLADLVLLGANPLEDITNTRRIRAVIADGRLYRRADLNRILAEVEASVRQADVPRAVANDNRSPAGIRRDGALEIALVVTEARWYPEADSGPSEIVQAFGEEGEPPRIPGPLIRVPAGTEIRARVRNALASSRVILYGFHARPGSRDDTLHLAPGATREIRFSAGEPGTYFYAGTTTVLGFDPDQPRREDSQLHGAFVVDPPGATGPPEDRVFVIGHWSAPPDPAGPPPIVVRDMMTINGKSWPHTERMAMAVGDTVRWRWLNSTVLAHPMHLHGFFFRVKSRGTWAADTVYGPGEDRGAVTEHMEPGGTMAMEWVPEEPGNWLFHCHNSLHVSHFVSLDKVPEPEDPLGPAAPDHTVSGMRGLILGISVEPDGSTERRPEVYGSEARQIRLLAQSAPRRYGEHEGVGYLIHEGGPAPPRDSVPTMSPPLVLRRGEPVNITVVNRLRAPTGVHWHGMELPSYPDGVPGWSGTPGRLAPPIAPGDSFVAAFTPPRAGTFIYHSHSNEYYQISSGLYGPLIVVDPEEGYDPERERIFVVGGNGPVGWEQGRVNGRIEPDTMELLAGESYRLRLININPDWKVFVALREGDRLLQWRAVAKDGADLPANQAVWQPAHLLMGQGETADFEFTSERAGDLTLEVTTRLEQWTVPVPIRVRSRSEPRAPGTSEGLRPDITHTASLAFFRE